MNVRTLVVALAAAGAWIGGPAAQAPPATDRVTIEVDAARPRGPMKPMWAWFGYDEPNYTYMKEAQVEIAVENAKNGQPTLTHYRIDGERSNSYAAWQKMGSPAAPTEAQQRALESAGQLQQLDRRSACASADGRVTLTVQLPRQGVSLLTLTY